MLGELTPFEIQLRNQILKNWKNYRLKRIDLAIARDKLQFDIAGKYICVAKVSSATAAATIILNEKDNDELDLEEAVEIETLFKHFFISNAVQEDEWINLIIGADFKYKKKVEAECLEHVYRGDPDIYDWDVGDFIVDDAWHDLDLSGIIPAGTKLVHFNCIFMTSVPYVRAFFRTNGQVNEINRASIMTNPSLFDGDFFVVPDENRVIEYCFKTLSEDDVAAYWGLMNVSIGDWFV